MGLKTKGGKLLSKNGKLCNTCCGGDPYLGKGFWITIWDYYCNEGEEGGTWLKNESFPVYAGSGPDNGNADYCNDGYEFVNYGVTVFPDGEYLLEGPTDGADHCYCRYAVTGDCVQCDPDLNIEPCGADPDLPHPENADDCDCQQCCEECQEVQFYTANNDMKVTNSRYWELVNCHGDLAGQTFYFHGSDWCIEVLVDHVYQVNHTHKMIKVIPQSNWEDIPCHPGLPLYVGIFGDLCTTECTCRNGFWSTRWKYDCVAEAWSEISTQYHMPPEGEDYCIEGVQLGEDFGDVWAYPDSEYELTGLVDDGTSEEEGECYCELLVTGPCVCCNEDCDTPCGTLPNGVVDHPVEHTFCPCDDCNEVVPCPSGHKLKIAYYRYDCRTALPSFTGVTIVTAVYEEGGSFGDCYYDIPGDPDAIRIWPTQHKFINTGWYAGEKVCFYAVASVCWCPDDEDEPPTPDFTLSGVGSECEDHCESECDPHYVAWYSKFRYYCDNESVIQYGNTVAYLAEYDPALGTCTVPNVGQACNTTVYHGFGTAGGRDYCEYWVTSEPWCQATDPEPPHPTFTAYDVTNDCECTSTCGIHVRYWEYDDGVITEQLPNQTDRPEIQEGLCTELNNLDNSCEFQDESSGVCTFRTYGTSTGWDGPPEIYTGPYDAAELQESDQCVQDRDECLCTSGQYWMYKRRVFVRCGIEEPDIGISVRTPLMTEAEANALANRCIRDGDGFYDNGRWRCDWICHTDKFCEGNLSGNENFPEITVDDCDCPEHCWYKYQLLYTCPYPGGGGWDSHPSMIERRCGDTAPEGDGDWYLKCEYSSTYNVWYNVAYVWVKANIECESPYQDCPSFPTPQWPPFNENDPDLQPDCSGNFCVPDGCRDNLIHCGTNTGVYPLSEVEGAYFKSPVTGYFQVKANDYSNAYSDNEGTWRFRMKAEGGNWVNYDYFGNQSWKNMIYIQKDKCYALEFRSGTIDFFYINNPGVLVYDAYGLVGQVGNYKFDFPGCIKYGAVFRFKAI